MKVDLEGIHSEVEVAKQEKKERFGSHELSKGVTTVEQVW